MNSDPDFNYSKSEDDVDNSDAGELDEKLGAPTNEQKGFLFQGRKFRRQGSVIGEQVLNEREL